MDRLTGKTTTQIKNAPKGAVFIWCNGTLGYPKDLARSLDREDLLVVGPSYVSNLRSYASTKPVVVDHAARFTLEQWAILDRLHARGLLSA